MGGPGSEQGPAGHPERQAMPAQGPDSPPAEGLRFEQKTFAATFATGEAREGMTAFPEKRAARFEGG